MEVDKETRSSLRVRQEKESAFIYISQLGGVFVLMKRGARMECAMTIVSTLR